MIDETSVKVVLNDGEMGDIIFYLTEFKDKWYLSILDQVSSDCGS